MLIVLPVAGRGSRFYPESVDVPKCLIPVRGRLMIEWALGSIWHQEAEIIVVYHCDQLPLIRPALKGLLPQARLIEQTTPLRGAADTVYQASSAINNKRDIVVMDCDVYAKSTYQCENWHLFNCDGSVLTFVSNCPSKSYVSVKDGYVVDTVEKTVISDQAIGGIYHFRDGRGLLSAIDEQLRTRQADNGEFYLSQALKIYLKSHPAFVPVTADTFFDIGFPEGVKAFEKCSFKE